MSILLQISDTHFGTEQPPVVEALVTLAHAQQPDLVALAGDITQRARRSQFRAAKHFITRMGRPVVAIPGNHDIALFDLWTRMRRPYAPYCNAFGDELEPVYRSNELLVVCVNTTRAYLHKNGEVSAQQIERVAHLLEQAQPDQLRVVVVHQPIAVTQAQDVPNRLRGHAVALQRWARAGVDLILGGHIHLPHVIAMHGLARPVWVVQAGTAVSSRIRQGTPNSVNILRWSANQIPRLCKIEQWDFSEQDQAFVCTQARQVEPDRR